MLPPKLAEAGGVAESAILRSFDGVSTISEAMRRRLLEKGVPEARTRVFFNWVDLSAVDPLRRPLALREELGAGRDTMLVLYAGNLGEKQGLHTLVEAAHLLREAVQVRFVIAGEGSASHGLRLRAAELRLVNTVFLPLQPADRFANLLAAADLHVLTERRGASDRVMPSKMGAVLASGRPVVAAGAQRSSLGRIITRAKAGMVTAPEDPRALAEAILAVSRDTERAAAMGAAGRRYAEENLGREAVLGRFLAELEELASWRHREA
jgi:colanic acid biosynthesis glycosyl transferase WcaI